jgi:hypothetical protein
MAHPPRRGRHGSSWASGERNSFSAPHFPRTAGHVGDTASAPLPPSSTSTLTSVKRPGWAVAVTPVRTGTSMALQHPALCDPVIESPFHSTRTRGSASPCSLAIRRNSLVASNASPIEPQECDSGQRRRPSYNDGGSTRAGYVSHRANHHHEMSEAPSLTPSSRSCLSRHPHGHVSHAILTVMSLTPSLERQRGWKNSRP